MGMPEHGLVLIALPSICMPAQWIGSCTARVSNMRARELLLPLLSFAWANKQHLGSSVGLPLAENTTGT